MSSARPIATTRTSAGMPTGRLAVWWVIASEIVIFGGIIASYVMFRLSHESFGVDAASTKMWIGAVNTFVLLTSSLFAVLGHKAAEAGDGRKAANMLYLTCGGGLIFLIIKAFEWNDKISHGHTLSSSTFFSFYYTAAGLHALHVLAGVIIMMIVAQTARRNLELHRVELIGIYWHFVDVIWIFLFPLLYIAK